MSTILHDGELITYVHDERLRPAAQSSGGGKLATYRTWGPNTGSGRYSLGADTKSVDKVRILYQVDLVTA
jgi:hypothetical protein